MELVRHASTLVMDYVSNLSLLPQEHRRGAFENLYLGFSHGGGRVVGFLTAYFSVANSFSGAWNVQKHWDRW